jgi:hypothetical protein
VAAAAAWVHLGGDLAAVLGVAQKVIGYAVLRPAREVRGMGVVCRAHSCRIVQYLGWEATPLAGLADVLGVASKVFRYAVLHPALTDVLEACA